MANRCSALKQSSRAILILCCCVLGFITGCSKKAISDPQDPYESFNRKMFAVNNAVDRITLRPVSVVYTHIIPSPLRRMIHRFFANLDTVPTIVNDILQGRGTFAASDSWRLIFNSTIGIGGLFDPATHFGLPPHNNDFGLTLHRWGAEGTYSTPFGGSYLPWVPLVRQETNSHLIVPLKGVLYRRYLRRVPYHV